LLLMIYLTKSVAPSNIAVVSVYFGVYFILERSFFVEWDVFEIYIVPDWIALVHNFNFFVFQAKCKKLLWVCDALLFIYLLLDLVVFMFGAWLLQLFVLH